MDYINTIEELEEEKSENSSQLSDQEPDQPQQEVSDYIIESSEECAEIMQNEIKITDVQIGLF